MTRVFLEETEAAALASQARALDATLPDIIRTLLRMWMDGEIVITAADIAEKRGRHRVRAA